MSEQQLDALLKRMGEIATAVNSFTSEDVQRSAFATLVAAFGLPPQPTQSSATKADVGLSPPEDNGETEVSERSAGKPGKGRKPRAKPNGKIGFKVVKDLDLRPTGKKSFADFIAEKQPDSNQDKFAVAVYYLENVIEMDAVTSDHVGTVFRLTEGWREPTDLVGSLKVTSTRKSTIDTSDISNIKMTPTGRNFVEHDLPPKVEAKKK